MEIQVGSTSWAEKWVRSVPIVGKLAARGCYATLRDDCESSIRKSEAQELHSRSLSIILL